MAQLSSPGVSVTVIDESFYTPAAPGTVPLIFVATEENKQNSSGSGIAPGTLAENAGEVYLITSQRDLSDTFGTPVFKTDVNNNPIHGGEQNEYGLQAAYSYLGVSNRAYVVRAGIDLGQLTATPIAPAGAPDDGDWWFDIANTNFGIFEWDGSSALTGGQKFVVKSPMIINDLTNLELVNESFAPKASIGSVDSYAVVTYTNLVTLWYKKARTDTDPKWVEVGSVDWVKSRAVIKGTKSVLGTNQVTAGLSINGVSISEANDTVNTFINKINNMSGISAALINGKLEIYSTGADVTLTEVTTNSWSNNFGINTGKYNVPALEISKHTKVPEWKTNDSTPRPTGSVWIKTTVPNLGANWSVKNYNAATGMWVTKSAPIYRNNTEALKELDLIGGGINLAKDTVYVRYDDDQILPIYANFKIYVKKANNGSTSITSAALTTAGTYKFKISESIAGSANFESTPEVATEVTFADGASQAENAGKLAQAINELQYKNIVATIESDNKVTVSHILGGEIFIRDETHGLTGEKEVSVLFPVMSANNLYATPLKVMNVIATANNSSSLTGITDISGIELGMVVNPYNQTDGPVFVAEIEKTGNTYNLVLNKSISASGTVTVSIEKSAYTGSLWTADENGNSFITASAEAPTNVTADGRLWYNSTIDEVDILVNAGDKWVGYQYAGDQDGTSKSPYYTTVPANKTDPNGPIVMASEPTTQSDGTPLANGDIWISTENIENYPEIYVYDTNFKRWNLIDKTDQTTENGIIFADARWTAAGDADLARDPINSPSSITELLTSDYVDFDAPDPTLYPRGMLLWNLRRSGFNVKKYVHNYVDVNSVNSRYNDELQTNYYPHRWVTVSANQEDGAGSFGRLAQRKVVVQSLQALVNSNQDIRDEEGKVFNLIACPGYPELVGEMVSLNYDRQLTAFVIGDTPARLAPDATSLSNWGNNRNQSLEDGDKGLNSFDEYLAFFYPWGYTSDNLGNNVVVPPSHMILRMIALSDNVSYPWFAPAGTRRGMITNATSVGYIDNEGEFRSVFLNTGQRDTLAAIKVNPIAFISGSGLVNFGQQTRARNASALDRINVARLIVFLRRQLTLLARPYIFEPNDKITRDEFKGAIEGVMLGLVGQRALYDFIVVCDQSNNTPARIDRYELWADVAIEPVKAAEFIYIPLRLKNTGEISGGTGA